ncbi:gamma carbonic anhydrase family protein [Desulfonema ishimotonii]|uniref:Gamma carbonic anhydrase family protein n=1 Tax=Desulfonema ishimotonii TaxID=45657 RepID=A0A401FRS7_9BACT|nr:gamma carbonic anhydrase family protein [Desulfonema ishimotonii]GBC59666.1 gamma carbonic anhydrase family protein [Desulfonema ishimotonii]
MIFEYKGKRPKIGKNVFIAPGAVIIGDVTIGDNSGIWYNSVVRGDSDSITIGKNTNIQDNCTVHIDKGKPMVIGDNVTIGHNAVVHGCTIEDHCLIGINATVLNGAHIRRGSIIASNALVREGQKVGPFHLVAGVPAILKKEMGEDMIGVLQVPADIYVKKALEFKDLKRIEP